MDSIIRHSEISRDLSTEDIVLLENNGVLPMKMAGTVGLWGSGAFKTRCSSGQFGGPGGPPMGPGNAPEGPGGPPMGPGDAPEGPGGPPMGPGDTSEPPDESATPAPPPPMMGNPDIPGFHRNISDALQAAGYTLLTDERGMISDQKPDYTIYVLRRESAEGSDRKDTQGDYYLTDEEVETLQQLAADCGNVILILNCCAVTDFYTTMQQINSQAPNGIGAVLYMGLGGEGAGDAVVSVLNGAVSPSGKLADTWALSYDDYPSSVTFGERGHHNFDHSGDTEYYREGIFVGYRYFDTFHVPVAYPFGFGKSYTDFSMQKYALSLSEDSSELSLTIDVKNVGAYTGKEVVQAYASYRYSPDTSRLETPYQALVGYKKTNALCPGESEAVTISFPLRSMASYDEATDCFVLQAGDYFLRVGSSSRDTSVAAILTLDEEVVVEHCTPGLFALGSYADALKEKALSYKDITNSPLPFETWDGSGAETLVLPVKKLRELYVDNQSQYQPDLVTTYISTDPQADSFRWKSRTTENKSSRKEIYIETKTLADATLADVATGRISIEQFVAGLSTDELNDLVTGLSSEQTAQLLDTDSPLLKACREGVSGYQGTRNLITKRLIPQIYQADGPESPGITLTNDEIWAGKKETDTKASYSAVMLPSETVMAQSWNPDLVRTMGEAVGDEMRSAGLSIWLAPGANIHRDPLGGRGYQYYSEDPFITGSMLTAEVSGVQSRGGVFCCAKHFAANNMETNRGEVNEVISERALREIYLPGWRMCAQSEYPNGSFMSAYQQINGVFCGESYDLLTHLIRGEWKWDGMVMDDYTPWFFLCWRDLTKCPQVGNDLVMPGNTSDNVMPVPFVPMDNPVTSMDLDGKTGPFQSDTYLMSIALRNGTLLLGDLQKSAMAVLKLYMKTAVFEELKASYSAMN